MRILGYQQGATEEDWYGPVPDRKRYAMDAARGLYLLEPLEPIARREALLRYQGLGSRPWPVAKVVWLSFGPC